MPGLDIVRDAIVEFSRIQNWMLSAKRNGDEETYDRMLDRYIELKAVFQRQV